MADVPATKPAESLGRERDLNRFESPSKKGGADTVLETRVEATAHSASNFFDLPYAKIQKGETIGVYKNDEGTFANETFEYNLDQFKNMNCTSFEDMTKVCEHECAAYRLSQNTFPTPWAKVLGADFFAGVRSEMIGLPKSNFEKMIGSTEASTSHPDGALRMQAIDYGRNIVAQMKLEGMQPTWENCLEAYKESPFAQMKYENAADGIEGSHVENGMKNSIEGEEKGKQTISSSLESNIENTEEATERTSMFEDQTIDNDKLEELRSEIEPNLKLGKEHDGAVLRENLEQSMNIKSNPEISDAHHIVGRDTPQAAKKLKDFGIDCNDPANGILLPNSHESPLKGAVHGKGRHIAEYSNEVEQRMSSAATREEGLDVLQSLKEDLYNGELSLHADAKPNK